MNEEGKEDVCVVCCREVEIYAVGLSCTHLICYECSTRMRVLCKQKECPVCRQDVPVVLFTRTKNYQPKGPYEFAKYPYFDRKSAIAFEDESVRKAYDLLLEHRCQCKLSSSTVCGEEFSTFVQLKDHVRRKHEMFYCELCVDNLRIFTFERKCYNRKDLARHKRLGDEDNSSYHEHPLCTFCDQRFFDADELYRHLRTDHFFCHFCDRDGRDEYYSDYPLLNDHFRKMHYLCEEGECVRDRYTNVFCSEIDFKAHKATRHTRNKSKAEVKEARTLNFDFNFTPRNAQNGETSPNHNDLRFRRYGRQANHQRNRNVEESVTREMSENAQAQSKSVNTQCVQEFPHLSGTAEASSISNAENNLVNNYSNPFHVAAFSQSGRNRRNMQIKGSGINTEEFPALSSTSASSDRKPVELPQKNNKQSCQAKNRQEINNKRESSYTSEFLSDDNCVEDKKPSTPWVKKKETLSFDDEFPKLVTKQQKHISNYNSNNINNNNNSNTFLKNTGNEEPAPVITNTTSEMLAEQIVKKCKSKKKKKNKSAESLETNSENSSLKHNKSETVEPSSLTKLYSGLGTRGLTDQENVDPSTLKNIANDLRSKYMKKDEEDDDVPWREKVSFVNDDFPPLPSDNATPKLPPGFSISKSSSQPVPPPGFSNAVRVSNTNHSISLSSVAQQLTKSNDKNETLLQHNNDKGSLYLKPPDFDTRNQLLIQKIQNLAKLQDSFSVFKSLSGSFRQGKMSALEYHSKCAGILGKEGFLEIFTELVSLLPDIKKQQELLAVHNKFLQKHSKKSGAIPKYKINGSSSLIVCSACQQVLIKDDVTAHENLHSNE